LLAAQLFYENSDYEQAEYYYEMALAQNAAYLMDLKAMNNLSEESMRSAQRMRRKVWRKLGMVQRRVQAKRPSREWVREQFPYLDIPASGRIELSSKCKALEKGIWDESTSDPINHMLLGDCYLKCGDSSRAVVELLAVTQFNHNDVEAWHNLGLAYLQQGRLALAEKAFRKADSFNYEDSHKLLIGTRRARRIWEEEHPS
jgi:tetratricopeptide (TPR) repeat protein